MERSRRIPFIATRLRVSRSTSSKTASLGSGTSNRPRAIGRAADITRALPREDLLEPPAGDVREREQPQRLAGGRAVDDDRVEARPSSWWRLIWSSENSSSIPGGTVSSSAEIRSTPRSANRSPSQSWTASQWRSISSWACTSWPNRFGPTWRGLAAQLGLERVGERVRRVGRQHDRAQAGRRAAARGGGGHARLADAALARVEDGPRAPWTRPIVGASRLAQDLDLARRPWSSGPCRCAAPCSRAARPRSPGRRASRRTSPLPRRNVSVLRVGDLAVAHDVELHAPRASRRRSGSWVGLPCRGPCAGRGTRARPGRACSW